ncbi:MAG: type IV pilus biogenesis/stability protein PilW [Gammaproteobacteria bacterium]|nr:type IV pilus biogenesis/stability protein PilW [Gammaproteobacteria bacterium]
MTRTATLLLASVALSILSGCANTGSGNYNRASDTHATSTGGFIGVDENSCWKTPLSSTPSAPTQQEKLARIHLDLGVGYMQESALEIAAEELKLARELEPNYAKIHNAMALLHLRLGDQALAEKSYHQALRLDPADPEIHNNYGIYLCSRNQLDLAQQHFDCAIANPLYSTPFLAYTNAGLCAMKKPDLAAAERYFRSSLQLYRRQPTAHLQLARINLDRGDIEAANDHYRQFKKMAQHTLESVEIGMEIEQARGNNNAYSSLKLLHRSLTTGGVGGSKP